MSDGGLCYRGKWTAESMHAACQTHMKISKVALYVLGTCCRGLGETSTRAGGQLAKAQDWRAGWDGVSNA